MFTVSMASRIWAPVDRWLGPGLQKKGPDMWPCPRLFAGTDAPLSAFLCCLSLSPLRKVDFKVYKYFLMHISLYLSTTYKH
jgi:hypothetical protein